MKLFEIHVSITVRIIYYTDPETYYSTSSVVRFGTLYKWYGSLCEHCHIDRLTSPMTSDIETVIEEVKKTSIHLTICCLEYMKISNTLMKFKPLILSNLLY